MLKANCAAVRITENALAVFANVYPDGKGRLAIVEIRRRLASLPEATVTFVRATASVYAANVNVPTTKRSIQEDIARNAPRVLDRGKSISKSILNRFNPSLNPSDAKNFKPAWNVKLIVLVWMKPIVLKIAPNSIRLGWTTSI